MAGPKPMRATPMKTKKLVRNVRIEAPAPGRKTTPRPATPGPKPHVIKTDRVPIGGFANPVPKKNQPVVKNTNRGKKAR